LTHPIFPLLCDYIGSTLVCLFVRLGVWLRPKPGSKRQEQI
jgi:hypothetical protein